MSFKLILRKEGDSNNRRLLSFLGKKALRMNPLQADTKDDENDCQRMSL